MNPEIILSDFEKGETNAFKEIFPNVTLKGCHFHFTQAIWINIQENGLCLLCKSNKLIRNCAS